MRRAMNMRFKPAAILLAAALWMPLGVSARAAAPAAQEGVTAIPRPPWMQPPPEFKEMQRQGFHAGVKAAIKDYDHHRFPDFEHHKEYRHPKVDAAFRVDFRQGFRRGYNDAMKHLIKDHGEEE